MKKISDDELKRIQFQILKDFKEVCEKNALNYSLIGGTLLGAIRHQGFIPWDDDIDVCMPRDDYERFTKICSENRTPFILISNKTNKNYGYLFAKLSNPNTKIVEHTSNRREIDLGVHIDLFIYDALGDNKKEAMSKFNKTSLKREILVAANWKKYSKSKTHSIIYEPVRLLFFLLSRLVNYSKTINKIEKIYLNDSFYDHSFVGNLCSDKRAKSIIERHNFDRYVDVLFEGEKFKALSGYEEYLKITYGDYMALPPEQKRVTHHTFDAYWKD